MSAQTVARVWIAGARPRTLVAAVVPVLVGTAAAARATPLRALGCLVVALGMQVGVNYANDYSDGVRGVDTQARVGPARLTASGLASARAVALAAALSFGVAGVAGLLLARAAGWELVVVGVLAVAAAVLYSGGPRPYAALGLGELFVFVFFGLVATCGTAYAQSGEVRGEAWLSAVPVGLLAVAILMANNVRDIATDATAGKRTLAVRVGDARTRGLYRIVVVVALLWPAAGAVAGALPPGAALSLAVAPLAVNPLREIGRARGVELLRVLGGTAMLHLQFGALLALGLWLS